MAKLVFDSQSVKTFVTVVVLFSIFFYGVMLASGGFDSNYIGDEPESMAGSSFDADKYEADTNGSVLNVNTSTKTLGGSFNISEGEIPGFSTWSLDYSWTKGEWVKVETEIWSNHTIWQSRTVDLSTDFDYVSVSPDLKRFGTEGSETFLPNIEEDYNALSNRIGDAPDVISWIFVAVPLVLILMILKAFDVSIA